jgi:hypothetical protein
VNASIIWSPRFSVVDAGSSEGWPTFLKKNIVVHDHIWSGGTYALIDHHALAFRAYAPWPGTPNPLPFAPGKWIANLRAILFSLSRV